MATEKETTVNTDLAEDELVISNQENSDLPENLEFNEDTHNLAEAEETDKDQFSDESLPESPEEYSEDVNADDYPDVDPINFDEQEITEDTPETLEDADDSENKTFPDIPEYARKKEYNQRHKLLQNALLTPELIKLFDIICQNIILREKNYFNITEFLVSSNFSSVQKDNLQHNFLKLVDLLTDKTVDLIKIQERGRDSRAIAISLKSPKNFDLALFHKFNDFVKSNYNQSNPLHKPILYQLDRVAESIRVSKEKLVPFCLRISLKDASLTDLKKLVSEQKEESGKAVVLIDLHNEQFGEAIFPLNLASNLLAYLCVEMNEYLSNVSNEKVSALIKKKLQESKIEFTNIKKFFSKPDPHNAEFSAFIRIFYSIISQVYSKNINYSTKKIKETESFLVISLIARQLILNAKLSDNPKEERPKLITEDMIVRLLLDQTKEVNDQIVCIPVTLDSLTKKSINISHQPVYPTRDQLIDAFQKLNSNIHTIKEILILRHNATNYYIHRSAIVPLFLNLLEVEKPKMKRALENEIEANRRHLLRNKANYEEFINGQVNLVLKLTHECLSRCLMTNKPVAYHDNQSLYWVNRLFLAKDELIRYKAENTELDYAEDGKKNLLKNLIKTITFANKDFKTLAEVLDIPYENYAHQANFSLFFFITRLWKKIFGKGLSKKPIKIRNSFSSKSEQKNPELNSLHKDGLSKSSGMNRTSSKNYSREERERSKEIAQKFETIIPLLKTPEKIEQKINEEMDNWNLKIGESRKRNQQIVDGIINGYIVRLDNSALTNESLDKIFEVIVRNNPVLKQIKNQESLKNYMMFKIMYKKYKRLTK